MTQWYRFCASDWRNGCYSLSLEEEGLYIRIVAFMYDTCKPLPADYALASRLLNVQIHKYKKLVDLLIAKGKILVVGKYLVNERVQKEIERTQQKKLNAQKAAGVRWTEQKQPPQIPPQIPPQLGGGFGPGLTQNLQAKSTKDECGRNAIVDKSKSNSKVVVSNAADAPADQSLQSESKLDQLEAKLTKAANGALSRVAIGLQVLSEPLSWIEHGCDLDLDVVPAVKALAERKHRSGGQINSWNFFRNAVFENRDARLARRAPPHADAAADREAKLEAKRREYDQIIGRRP